MTDEQANSIAPPYISFRTFLNLIERLASAGIPQHIDRHYWKGFLSGSLGPQVMTALRFFVLITGTDNTPTPELGSLVEDKEHRKQLFAEMLQRFYVPVFKENNLARATMGDLDRTFIKHYKLSAETRRKAISFFLHAVQYVELPLSSYLKEASRTGGGAAKSPSRSGTKKQPSRATTDSSNHRTQEPKFTASDVPLHRTKTQNVKVMTFPDGEVLTLSYSGEVFAMDRQYREFLFSLIDEMSSFERKLANGNDTDDAEEELEEDGAEEGEEMTT